MNICWEEFANAPSVSKRRARTRCNREADHGGQGVWSQLINVPAEHNACDCYHWAPPPTSYSRWSVCDRRFSSVRSLARLLCYRAMRSHFALSASPLVAHVSRRPPGRGLQATTHVAREKAAFDDALTGRRISRRSRTRWDASRQTSMRARICIFEPFARRLFTSSWAALDVSMQFVHGRASTSIVGSYPAGLARRLGQGVARPRGRGAAGTFIILSSWLGARRSGDGDRAMSDAGTDWALLRRGNQLLALYGPLIGAVSDTVA